MDNSGNRYSEYQTAIIEICGEMLASEQDWNDTELLEEVWYSKYPEGFPIKAAFELLFMNNAPKEAIMETTNAGQLMKVFIEARLSRFVWQPGDFRVLSDEESREVKTSNWPSPDEKITRSPGNEEAAESIDGMTSAVAKSGFEKPIITYRALVAESDPNKTVLSSLKPGRVIMDKAFLSTTLNKNNLKWLKGVMLVPIYTPPGTPALYLPSIEILFKEETELVLQRGTSLRILDPKQVEADKTQLPVIVLPGE